MQFIVYNRHILEKYEKEARLFFFCEQKKKQLTGKKRRRKKDGKEAEESVYDHGACDRDRGDCDSGGGADSYVYESY